MVCRHQILTGHLLAPEVVVGTPPPEMSRDTGMAAPNFEKHTHTKESIFKFGIFFLLIPSEMLAHDQNQ